jgi:hypothetical protein
VLLLYKLHALTGKLPSLRCLPCIPTLPAPSRFTCRDCGRKKECDAYQAARSGKGRCLPPPRGCPAVIASHGTFHRVPACVPAQLLHASLARQSIHARRPGAPAASASPAPNENTPLRPRARAPSRQPTSRSSMWSTLGRGSRRPAGAPPSSASPQYPSAPPSRACHGPRARRRPSPVPWCDAGAKDPPTMRARSHSSCCRQAARRTAS